MAQAQASESQAPSESRTRSRGATEESDSARSVHTGPGCHWQCLLQVVLARARPGGTDSDDLKFRQSFLAKLADEIMIKSNFQVSTLARYCLTKCDRLFD